MSLLKSQKNNSTPAPVGASKEQLKAIEEFNKKAKELNEFMEKNNLGFAVQHQVIIVPKPSKNV